jgi:hypothetical protein
MSSFTCRPVLHNPNAAGIFSGGCEWHLQPPIFRCPARVSAVLLLLPLLLLVLLRYRCFFSVML